MEQLSRVAERILETARLSPGSDWTVLITHAGQTHMLSDNDWPLPSLLAERGAAMAFRVSHQATSIVVEGHSLRERCRLESVKPFLTSRFGATGHPAGIPRLLPAPWG